MNRIKELRLAKGVKQIAFAKEMGVGQSAISLWEQGRNLPSADKLVKMCEYFGVTLEYLLGADETPQNYMDYVADITKGNIGDTKK